MISNLVYFVKKIIDIIDYYGTAEVKVMSAFWLGAHFAPIAINVLQWFGFNNVVTVASIAFILI